MSRRIVGYIDGKAVWEDLGPGYAHVSWKQSGAISGSLVLPTRPHSVERSEAATKGWETRKLRGEGLVP